MLFFEKFGVMICDLDLCVSLLKPLFSQYFPDCPCLLIPLPFAVKESLPGSSGLEQGAGQELASPPPSFIWLLQWLGTDLWGYTYSYSQLLQLLMQPATTPT